MAKPIIVTTGFRWLDRKLKRLKVDNKKKKRAMTVAARDTLKKTMLKEARSKSPKKTGLLRKNIKVKSITRSRGFIGAKVSAGLPGKNDNTGDAYYGAFLLWGTKRRSLWTLNGESDRGKIKPNPWLYDVVKRKRKLTMREYKKKLKENIKKLARGKKV
jgi:HK97 gp10 family phage protein